MAGANYNNWTKEQLVEEVAKLRKRKKYGLVWEEKKEDVVEQCKRELPVLKEVKNKAIAKDKNGPVNILIEGDNYHALSVLNYTHKGKIDVIYIDPPYNRGTKDFKYNDDYVDAEDGFRHSKWLAFMSKRLTLARNLLKDTGVIFLSIDDIEIAQLKLLCDGIFSEGKLMGIIHWRKNRKPHNAAETISKSAEFILVYAKSRKIKLVQEYTIKDSDENGDFSDGPIFKADKRERIYTFPKGIRCEVGKISKGVNKSARNPKLYIEYLDRPIIKNGILQNKVRIKGRYCVTDERGMLSSEITKGNIFINKNGVPKIRVYREELLGKVANNLWVDKGYNEDASEEIKDLFKVDLASEIFEYPKPIKLIKTIAQCVNNKNAVILDFFACTGTTGHAILDLNQEDGGNRNFILCTNDENKIATKVCYPRILKVITGYKNTKGEMVKGINANLRYFRTAFVGAEPNDKNKTALTKEATEMLCVRENTFDSVKDSTAIKIFKNQKQHTGIVFDEDAIPALKKIIAKTGGPWSVYIFSLGDDTFEDEFEDMKQKVTISPIPEAILRVYRRIFKD